MIDNKPATINCGMVNDFFMLDNMRIKNKILATAKPIKSNLMHSQNNEIRE